MIQLLNPWIYELTDVDYNSNYILNTSFNNECTDIANNYTCEPNNNIGNSSTLSLEFDGHSNYVEYVITNCLIDKHTLAWGGWFLPCCSNKKQYLVYSKHGLTMFIDTDNKLYIKLYTYYHDDYKYASFISNKKILINNWNYIVCVYNIKYTNIDVYINNELQNGTTCNGLKYPYLNGLNRIFLGYKNSKYYYKGIINKFFITNDYCIDNLLNNIYIPLSDPLSHWNICNYKDTKLLYDIYGKNNGTIYGKVFKLNFGKDKQYIIFNSESLCKLQDGAFSISLSLYLNNLTCKKGEYVLFSNLVYKKCTGYSITFVNNKNNTKYIKYILRKLNKNYEIISPIPIKIAEWHNILVTYNGINGIQLYHNYKCIGILNNIINGIIKEPIVPTYLGGNTIISFPGIINNIKVFNRLITNIEINNLSEENKLY